MLPGFANVRHGARAKLTCASYQKCARLLAPGEVKRVTQVGPLIGYFLACPACGFSAAYLHDAVGFVETRAPSARPIPWRLEGMTNEIQCFSCRRFLVIEDGFLVAVGSDGTAPCEIVDAVIDGTRCARGTRCCSAQH